MSIPSSVQSDLGVFDRARRKLTIGILLAVAAFALEGMGVVPALPTAVRGLGGLSLFGWSFSGFMLAWLVGAIGGGLIADSRGPFAPMALGLAAFAGGLLLAGSAHGMTQFLGGRVLQGAGGGGMIAAAYVAITIGYPDSLRARMMALLSSVWILPALVGPALSGAVVEWAGWRMVFFGVVPALGLVAAMVLPPLRRFSRHRPFTDLTRLWSATRLSLGVACLLLSAGRHDLLSVVALALLGLALIVPSSRALLPAGTFSFRSGLPAGLAARALLAFAFFGTEAFIPLAGSTLRGLSPARAGLALSAGAFGWITASWIQDRLETRFGPVGRARRVRGGFAVIAIGITIVAGALLSSAPPLLISLGWVVSGTGMGFAYSAGGLLCMRAAKPGREGEVSGQLQLSESVATALGAGTGSALFDKIARTGHGPRQALAAVFVLTLLAALFGTLVSRRLSAPLDADS